MKDCSICCETFNKSTRKPIECNYCQFQTCRVCSRTYILQSINEPSCMSCKVPWGTDFIWQSFTHVFYNTELETHRANILFEREKLQLPETQHKIYCEQLRAEILPLDDMVFFYENTNIKPTYYPMVLKRIAEIREVIGYTRISMNDARRKIDAVVRGCPQENCKGFITKSSFKCGVCSTKLCNQCHIILVTNDEEHICNKEDIETAKILTTNTKPCPKCREMIYKIDGCDQMWCIMCHTAFSWKTNEIENHIHNPHYYEWMRRNGQTIPRADGDQPVCNPQGELVRPELHYLNRLPLTPQQKECMLAVHRLIGHLQWSEIPRLNRQIDMGSSEEMKELFRKNYLRNLITEEQWKKTLISNLKKTEKWTKVKDVMLLFNRISIEQFHLILAANTTAEQYDECFMTIRGIRKYCNEVFQQLVKQYPMVPYVISKKMEIIREKKRPV